MNIFEGARRIVKVILAAGVLCAGIATITSHPYVSKYYALDENKLVKEVDGCSGQSSFLTHVRGTPHWNQIYFCGWSSGPEEIDLPDKERSSLNSAISAKRARDIGEGAMEIIIGAAIFWGFTWCVGWIVRGFLGIPSGQDYRIQSIKK